MLNSRLTETEKTRHFLILREKLGIDRPMVVVQPTHKEYLDKHEKEAVNLVARASGEGRAIVRPGYDNNSADSASAADLTSRERDICTKFVKLIQYHPSKAVNRNDKESENGETPSQGEKLLSDALANSSQHE